MRLAGKASISIITAVFLAGCARQTDKTNITEEKQVINAVETNVYNSNKQNNTKTYTLKDNSEEFISQIIIDESDNTFTFSYDVMSSYLAYGQYTESEGQLKLKTDDGKYHYTFDIIDENTLKFKQENSSRINRITGNGIADGAEFINAVETNVYNSNKQNNTKTYTLKDNSEEFISQIIIDESDNTFTFSYDVMSSYLAYGQYTESEGQLKLKTDDGKYHYTFDIIDENTLKFKQENSSRINRITGNGIADGAEFVTGILSGNVTNTDGLEILRKLYIDFPQDASYQEAISFIQESGLPYSERKLNGSRYIKIALEKPDTFIETPVINTFKNYDYIEASYMYPKKENNNNDELDKYFFAGIIYVSAGGYQLESHDNSTFITNKDGEIADSKMDRQEQMYFLESHTEPAIE